MFLRYIKEGESYACVQAYLQYSTRVYRYSPPPDFQRCKYYSIVPYREDLRSDEKSTLAEVMTRTTNCMHVAMDSMESMLFVFRNRQPPPKLATFSLEPLYETYLDTLYLDNARQLEKYKSAKNLRLIMASSTFASLLDDSFCRQHFPVLERIILDHHEDPADDIIKGIEDGKYTVQTARIFVYSSCDVNMQLLVDVPSSDGRGLVREYSVILRCGQTIHGLYLVDLFDAAVIAARVTTRVEVVTVFMDNEDDAIPWALCELALSVDSLSVQHMNMSACDIEEIVMTAARSRTLHRLCLPQIAWENLGPDNGALNELFARDTFVSSNCPFVPQSVVHNAYHYTYHQVVRPDEEPALHTRANLMSMLKVAIAIVSSCTACVDMAAIQHWHRDEVFAAFVFDITRMPLLYHTADYGETYRNIMRSYFTLILKRAWCKQRESFGCLAKILDAFGTVIDCLNFESALALVQASDCAKLLRKDVCRCRQDEDAHDVPILNLLPMTYPYYNIESVD